MFVYNIDIIIRSIFVNRKKNIEKFIFLSKVKVMNTIYRNGNNYSSIQNRNRFFLYNNIYFIKDIKVNKNFKIY